MEKRDYSPRLFFLLRAIRAELHTLACVELESDDMETVPARGWDADGFYDGLDLLVSLRRRVEHITHDSLHGCEGDLLRQMKGVVQMIQGFLRDRYGIGESSGDEPELLRLCREADNLIDEARQGDDKDKRE